MEEDTGATQLMLEALFDIKVALYEIREFLIGGDDGSEEETEEEDGLGNERRSRLSTRICCADFRR